MSKRQNSIAAQVARNAAAKIAAHTDSIELSVERIENITQRNYRWLREFQDSVIKSLRGSGESFTEDAVQIESQSAMNAAAELVASGYRLDQDGDEAITNFQTLTRQLYQVAKRVERAEEQVSKKSSEAARIQSEVEGYPRTESRQPEAPTVTLTATKLTTDERPAVKPATKPTTRAESPRPRAQNADNRPTVEQTPEYDRIEARKKALREKVRELAPRLLNTTGDIDAAIDETIRKDQSTEGNSLEELGIKDLSLTINRMNVALRDR